MSNKRNLTILGSLLIIWAGFTLAAYFVSHKPIALQVLDHLGTTLWGLMVTSVLSINALSLGRLTMKIVAKDFTEESAGILIASGIGLGELGLLGFGLAATGLSNFSLLLVVQVGILGAMLWFGPAQASILNARAFLIEFAESIRTIPLWMKLAAVIALIATFARTFLPPIEAFDALLYHLRVPELWIQDGGLRDYNIPHYWFPGLVEGLYFWGLGLHSEIVSQQMHFLWAVFLTLLIWHWTNKLWGSLAAGWSLTLLISMPSFLLLASWAYTDMALSFYGTAMLYCLWQGQSRDDPRIWNVGAIAAGLAMGVKYTSFVMPLSAILLITLWKIQKSQPWIPPAVQFSFISGLIGAVWYLRNWVWMDNPFYPFVFGGKYWDAFRASWFSGAGTGIGWDIKGILSLPLTVTMGNLDANFFDGNIGPLFLLSLPLAFYVFFTLKQLEPLQKTALVSICVFVGISTAFWIFGYISTRNLWQTRLLLPALVPFAIPSAIGLATIHLLDKNRLRPSFIVTTLVTIAVMINLLDAVLGVIARNPSGIAIGTVTRENYSERYQPGYFHALELISQTPEDSSIYSLFEPRSYGSTRLIQPDPILDNFPHDLFLNKSPGAIIESWRAQGYTHVLLNVRGADYIYQNADDNKSNLNAALQLLSPIETSADGAYTIYKIP